jgi:hypothetical protein
MGSAGRRSMARPGGRAEREGMPGALCPDGRYEAAPGGAAQTHAAFSCTSGNPMAAATRSLTG